MDPTTVDQRLRHRALQRPGPVRHGARPGLCYRQVVFPRWIQWPCMSELAASTLAKKKRLASNAISVSSQSFWSPLGRYATSVFIVWMLLLVLGYFFYGQKPGRPTLHAFGGFLPGMLAMYIATRVYGTR